MWLNDYEIGEKALLDEMNLVVFCSSDPTSYEEASRDIVW